MVHKGLDFSYHLTNSKIKIGKRNFSQTDFIEEAEQIVREIIQTYIEKINSRKFINETNKELDLNMLK